MLEDINTKLLLCSMYPQTRSLVVQALIYPKCWEEGGGFWGYMLHNNKVLNECPLSYKKWVKNHFKDTTGQQHSSSTDHTKNGFIYCLFSPLKLKGRIEILQIRLRIIVICVILNYDSLFLFWPLLYNVVLSCLLVDATFFIKLRFTHLNTSINFSK